MMQKYNRKVNVLFGPRGGPLREVTDLRVRFKITKSLKEKANSAVIEVYNLNSESRAALKADDPVVQLVAGYEGLQKGVWFGDVTRVVNSLQGVDRITKLESGDGEKDLQETVVSRSYAAGTPLKQVVKDVIGSFRNLSFSQVLDGAIDATKQLVTGGTVEGPASAVLGNLLGGVGLTYSVQDGEVVLDGDPTLQTGGTVVVSPATGLVETPALTKDGVTFRVLLEPSLRPGSLVQLESATVSGLYKVTEVVHDGDNWAQNWYSNVEAKPNE